MRNLAMGLLGAVALAMCAGCSANMSDAPASFAGQDGAVRTTPDCHRHGGVYNRAADLCIGIGGGGG